MLDANLKTQLKAYLEKVARSIEIVVSLDDSEKSREMSELLNEIASLSDRVTLVERHNLGGRKPSFSIGEAGKVAGIRWTVPLSNRFGSWTVTSFLRLTSRCRARTVRKSFRPST
jgi:alkyl hydroperoxide reductase subunit F